VTRKISRLLALALLAAAAMPAQAEMNAPAPRLSTPSAIIPAQLTPPERSAYRAAFAAIRAGNWADAAARLDAMPAGLLTPFARAELFTASSSPAAAGDALVALLAGSPDLPQAADIARLARARGAVELPTLPVPQDLARVAGPSRRATARSLRSDAVAAALGARILPLIKDDRPSDAEILLGEKEADLSSEALTEWQQRVAWSYFLSGDDGSARRLAARAQAGAGDWAVQADWVAGLAAWRQKDCEAAATAFTQVATRARDSEMMAAGLFWASRADMACGRPEKVQARLRSAARLPETFYGLLASAALGQALPAREMQAGFIQADWTTISKRRNARIAAALVEIGEQGHADTVLRHQARIGDRQDHEALLHLAGKLALPGTQLWLSRNAPVGARPSVATRYPMPAWTPQGGWQVDKALVYAHALQESQFRADVVSPAGARGLMQIMPGTAQLIAKKLGTPVGPLNDPQTNMAYGQFYLRELAGSSGTGGLLPKVIAAYNAGPGAVMKWNDRRRDNGDPLLFIESIPYYETRAYVAIVLRNYWMYRRQEGAVCGSLKAMAQGMWPRFPGLPGRMAVRLDSVSGLASAD
jgi:soluble lytic murein transglycosylase